jgi:caffeoyl-CoA O-methyltransferase
MFDIVKPSLQAYCDEHTSPESKTLQELNRFTHANVLQPRMLSGHFQGRLLSMFSKMIKPEYILEIGTYTGYSAICLAEGLQKGGKLITIDINPEQEENIYHYFKKAGMEQSIQFIVGDALNIIKTLPYRFDIVFIDADKPNYVKYYELVMPLLKKDGYIFADNVLWSGKVVEDESIKKDRDTQLLDAFNKHVKNDPRIEQVLLPVRDGILIGKKVSD